jgi:hypothetical protein
VVTQLQYMSDRVGRAERRGNIGELRKRTFVRTSFRSDPIHMKMASLLYVFAHDAAHARHVFMAKVWSAYNGIVGEEER